MKNIWKIFSGDVRRLGSSSIALLVAMGLCVVPALYAWFNIAASWDPYGKTGNLRVAVASEDQGYQGSLIPLELNAGEKLLSRLRENHQLDWIVTTPEEAVEGVRAGTYYAAVVIPEAFSRDLMSLFGEDMNKPRILYYLNEKENAIAPKITDKGAGAIQTKINETFSKTLSEVLLAALETAANLNDRLDGADLLDRLSDRLTLLRARLDTGSQTLGTLTEMTESLETVLTAVSQGAEEAAAAVSPVGVSLEAAREEAEGAAALLDSAQALTEESREDLQSLWGDLQAQAQETLPVLEESARQGSDTLETVAGEVQVVLDRTLALREGMDALGLLLGPDQPLLRMAWQGAMGKLETSIARQSALHDALEAAARDLDEAADRSETARTRLEETGGGEILETEQLRAGLTQLQSLLTDGLETAAVLTASLEESAQAIRETASETDDALDSLNESLNASAEALTRAGEKTEALRVRLAAEGGDLSALFQDLMGRDAAGTSTFLSAPVELETRSLYPVSSYGSAMAPFYSTLAIWVGGVILSAMVKVQVSPRQREALAAPTESQLFLGRWLIFVLLGLFQSLLICLGDLFFLQIQCLHPGRFLLCGLFTGLVYGCIVYTFAVSWGDVGKAVCVVLLVIQVAGSGGTFPVEMTPGFFHRVYPYLPFTHSMAAMRECIAGLYGNTYWIELGKLGIYLPLCFFVGLVLRRPIIRANEFFEEKLKDTRVM